MLFIVAADFVTDITPFRLRGTIGELNLCTPYSRWTVTPSLSAYDRYSDNNGVTIAAPTCGSTFLSLTSLLLTAVSVSASLPLSSAAVSGV